MAGLITLVTLSPFATLRGCNRWDWCRCQGPGRGSPSVSAGRGVVPVLLLSCWATCQFSIHGVRMLVGQYPTGVRWQLMMEWSIITL